MANIYNLSDTWNDAGTPFFAIRMDVTDTASHADSMLLNLSVGGVTKAGISKLGVLILPSSNSNAERVAMQSGIHTFYQFVHANNWMAWGANGTPFFGFGLYSNFAPLVINHDRGSGQLVWASGFELESQHSVGLKRVAGAVLGVTDGTTGDGSLEVSYVRTKPLIVSALPAAATAGEGAHAFVTNALTPVYGSTVVGGGAVKTPVHSDGTNWIVG